MRENVSELKSAFDVIIDRYQRDMAFMLNEISILKSEVAYLKERIGAGESLQKTETSWMDDPAEGRIDNIEDAMSQADLNFFTQELFDGDEDQFRLTAERINEMEDFKSVVKEMRETFPEWDESSQAAYLFYMIVKRRFV